jgi:uncharacterized protein YbjT (DUF2867 family)
MSTQCVLWHVMTAQSKIIFLGATGAVGGEALKYLNGLSPPPNVTLLARRPIPTPHRLGLKCHVVDTVDPATYSAYLPGHSVAICTMGVGEPSKVSKAEFKRVDHDAVLAFAKACHAAGVKHFVLLGSVGSDATSPSFYLRSKGALRDSIQGLGFEGTTTFQPSMILTPTNRYGMSQAIMLAVWPAISSVLAGPLSKYRGIPILSLGRAIARAGLNPTPGHKTVHWNEIISRAA